jgi:hypothetical protein
MHGDFLATDGCRSFGFICIVFSCGSPDGLLRSPGDDDLLFITALGEGR